MNKIGTYLRSLLEEELMQLIYGSVICRSREKGEQNIISSPRFVPVQLNEQAL